MSGYEISAICGLCFGAGILTGRSFSAMDAKQATDAPRRAHVPPRPLPLPAPARPTQASIEHLLTELRAINAREERRDEEARLREFRARADEFTAAGKGHLGVPVLGTSELAPLGPLPPSRKSGPEAP